MNKFITKVAKLVLGLSLAAGVGVAVGSRKAGRVDAAEVAYKTALFGSSYNSKGVSGYSDVSFDATNDGFTVNVANFNNNNNGWSFIKCGGKKGAYTGTIITDEAIDEEITKVVVTVDAITSGNVTAFKLYTSSNKSTWTEAGSFDKSTGAKEVTLSSPTDNLYYKVEIECSQGSANGLVTVSKVEYFYNSGTPSKTATVTEVTAPKTELLTNQNPSDSVLLTSTVKAGGIDVSGATVTFEANPANIVSLNQNGLTCTATAQSVGTTTITISYAGDSTYEASSDTISLTVVEPEVFPSGTANPITLSTSGGTSASAAKINGLDGIKAGTGSVAGAIVINVGVGANALTFRAAGWNGESVTLSITPNNIDGLDPTSLSLTADTGVSGNSPFTLAGSSSNYLKTVNFNTLGSATDFTFSATSGKRFVIWDANYYVPEGVALPLETPSPSYVKNDQEIQWSADSNADHYEISFDNGESWSTTSTTSSHDVSGLSSSASYTIKLKAVAGENDTSHTDSSVASLSFAIIAHAGSQADPYNVADARLSIDFNGDKTGVYATGIVSEIVTAYDSEHSNITFNFVDSANDQNFLQAYRCSGTDANDVAVGDTVIVSGDLTKFGGTYEFSSGCTLVSLTKSVVPTISFIPNYGKVLVGETRTYEATTNALGGASISYTSGNNSIATVDSSTGAVTGVALGSTTITATANVGGNDVTGTYTIYVVQAMTVAATRTYIDANTNLKHNYATGIVSNIETAYSAQNGVTFDIVDTNGDENFVRAYKCFGDDAADVAVGDIAVIFGTLKKYNDLYEFDSHCELVSLTTPEVQKFTVTYDAGEGTCETQTEQIAENGHPTFPIPTYSGHTFNGWQVGGTGTLYTSTNASDYTVVANVTFVANWTENVAPTPSGDSYQKITSTSDLEDGQYLIVYEGAEVAFDGSLNPFDAVGNTRNVDIESGSIASSSTIDEAAFTIETMEGGYSIKGSNDKYIGVSSYSNGLLTSNNAIANGISFDSDDNVLITVTTSGGTMTLKYNAASNQTRFRYYKSGQESIQLYKLVQSSNSDLTGLVAFIEETLYLDSTAADYINPSNESDGTACVEYLDLFIDMFNDDSYLNNAQRQIFADITSTGDSTVYLGRCRVNAWAAHQHKTISFAATTYKISLSNASGANLVSFINNENTNTVAIIVIISLVSVTAIGGYFFIRKRREN